MVSAVVVEALDTYWNPYIEAEEFGTIAERLLDVNYRDEVIPEVSDVNVKFADSYWRGTTDVRWNAGNRTDVITSPAGHRLYPSFDSNGHRVIRYFDTPNSNVTFRISYRVGDLLAVTMIRSVKVNDKWRNRVTGSYVTEFQWSDFGLLAEQRATYWIMAQLNKSL